MIFSYHQIRSGFESKSSFIAQLLCLDQLRVDHVLARHMAMPVTLVAAFTSRYTPINSLIRCCWEILYGDVTHLLHCSAKATLLSSAEWQARPSYPQTCSAKPQNSSSRWNKCWSQVCLCLHQRSIQKRMHWCIWLEQHQHCCLHPYNPKSQSLASTAPWKRT